VINSLLIMSKMQQDTEALKTRIYLARHGETEWNKIHRFQGRSDLPLNREGEKQARALAIALKEVEFTAIYSSPLSRALQTAQFVKEYHPSTPIFKEEGFLEMDLGEFDGMEAKHWIEQYPEFVKAWMNNPASSSMPGGESLEQVQVRALNSLGKIIRLYPSGATLLICGHNFVLLTILCHVLKIPLDRFRELKKGTASFSVICKEGNRFFAEVVNERAQLKMQ